MIVQTGSLDELRLLYCKIMLTKICKSESTFLPLLVKKQGTIPSEIFAIPLCFCGLNYLLSDWSIVLALPIVSQGHSHILLHLEIPQEIGGSLHD